jgi:uncharacterized membrane protein (UPF0182 family)
VLPINQSFLYIEPVYLESDTSALPELKRIVTASNSAVAMAETLSGSLVALSRGSTDTPIVVVDDGGVDGGAEPTPAPTPGVILNPQTVEEYVAAANAHLAAAEEAQRNGDWATYGRELEALQQTLAELSAVIDQTE